MACKWLAEAHGEGFAYPLQLFVVLWRAKEMSLCRSPFASQHRLHCRAGSLFGIHYAIDRNLADTYASCRAVALNATYRDFGTTHIPATLTFGAKTGSTRMDHA